MHRFSVPKIVSARFLCHHCKEESFLDIEPHGDFGGHMQCCHCNALVHVYCPTIGGEVVITTLSPEESIGIFKLQEKYKDNTVPYIIRKTKRREELL